MRHHQNCRITEAKDNETSKAHQEKPEIKEKQKENKSIESDEMQN